jgi:cytochrome c-type biogenesis protein CcmH
MIRAVFLACFAFFAFAAPALALDPSEILSDPKKEALARSISAELRCVKCQNETIDESDAPIAQDIRRMVRKQVQTGKTRQEILDLLVGSYGEYVLLRPRLSFRTFLLWVSPILFLMLGALLVFLTLHQTPKSEDTAPPLTEAEKEKLTHILDDAKS